MRALVRALAAAALGGLVAGACQDVRHVRLAISPVGFQCQEPGSPAPFLADRLIAGARPPLLSLVVDFISLDGLPDCRLPGLAGWCRSHPCAPIASARVCFSENLGSQLAMGAPPVGALTMLVASLRGQPVSNNAPTVPLLVRLVATTQSCAELQQSGTLAFDPNQLLGCAESCPVRLQDTDGDLQLDIDFLPTGPTDHNCEGQVQLCATAAQTLMMP